MNNRNALKKKLNYLYQSYNKAEFIQPDPLQFLSSYSNVADREIVGLVASSLAYGQVKTILKNLSEIFSVLGPHPQTCLLENKPVWFEKKLHHFKHRWHTGKDVVLFLMAIKQTLIFDGSLDASMQHSLHQKSSELLEALNLWVDKMREKEKFRKNLLSKPADGSACKRLMLYLRWMVRQDSVDPGGWNSLSPKQLFIPLDTHMHKMSLKLKLTKRQAANWMTVVDITQSLRQIEPDDPVKYDFIMTRPGIWKDKTLAKLFGAEAERIE